MRMAASYRRRSLFLADSLGSTRTRAATRRSVGDEPSSSLRRLCRFIARSVSYVGMSPVSDRRTATQSNAGERGEVIPLLSGRWGDLERTLERALIRCVAAWLTGLRG